MSCRSTTSAGQMQGCCRQGAGRPPRHALPTALPRLPLHLGVLLQGERVRAARALLWLAKGCGQARRQGEQQQQLMGQGQHPQQQWRAHLGQLGSQGQQQPPPPNCPLGQLGSMWGGRGRRTGLSALH